jgi:hypothetical protein
MSRALRIRRAIAIALLAAYSAWLAACLVSFFIEPPDARWTTCFGSTTWLWQLDFGFHLALALTASLGLARSWRWARMLSVSLALSAMFTPVGSLLAALQHLRAPDFDVLMRIAWSLALLACLRGPAFCAHYEGQPQVGLHWQTRETAVLWWAIVLNGLTIVRFAEPLMPPWKEGYYSSILLSPIHHDTPAYWASVALAALLVLGIGLLARQRTLGLLLTAVVSVVLPVALVACRDNYFDAQFARDFLLVAVPGILAAWLAVAFWGRAMWRTLRAD